MTQKLMTGIQYNQAFESSSIYLISRLTPVAGMATGQFAAQPLIN